MPWKIGVQGGVREDRVRRQASLIRYQCSVSRAEGGTMPGRARPMTRNTSRSGFPHSVLEPGPLDTTPQNKNLMGERIGAVSTVRRKTFCLISFPLSLSRNFRFVPFEPSPCFPRNPHQCTYYWGPLNGILQLALVSVQARIRLRGIHPRPDLRSVEGCLNEERKICDQGSGTNLATAGMIGG